MIGRILIELFGPDGKLKARRRVKNIVTNAGRQLVIDRLQGSPSESSGLHCHRHRSDRCGRWKVGRPPSLHRDRQDGRRFTADHLRLSVSRDLKTEGDPSAKDDQPKSASSWSVKVESRDEPVLEASWSGPKSLNGAHFTTRWRAQK